MGVIGIDIGPARSTHRIALANFRESGGLPFARDRNQRSVTE